MQFSAKVFTIFASCRVCGASCNEDALHTAAPYFMIQRIASFLISEPISKLFSSFCSNVVFFGIKPFLTHPVRLFLKLEHAFSSFRPDLSFLTGIFFGEKLHRIFPHEIVLPVAPVIHVADLIEEKPEECHPVSQPVANLLHRAAIGEVGSEHHLFVIRCSVL